MARRRPIDPLACPICGGTPAPEWDTSYANQWRYGVATIACCGRSHRSESGDDYHARRAVTDLWNFSVVRALELRVIAEARLSTTPSILSAVFRLDDAHRKIAGE